MSTTQSTIIPRVGALNEKNLRRLTAGLRAEPVKAAEAAAFVERDVRGFVRSAFDLDETQLQHLDVLLADESAQQLGRAYALVLRHGGEVGLELPPQQVVAPLSLVLEVTIVITRDPNGKITGIGLHVKAGKTQ
jgi:hypothetical protein